MKGDFSRLTFNKFKHFAAVLSQQGRVLLDSEQNEHEAIETFLRETSLTDIIGPSGVPLDDEHAFEITTVTSSDLVIQAGHMYVDGILVESDAQASLHDSLTHQPFITADGETISPPDAGTRTDLVYLEVWQQHVTALEDPDIREKALNIPDTTTRLRTLWRVHVKQDVGDVDCDDAISSFPPPPTDTTLTNDVSLAAQPEDPCVIAPDGGFRLLENRLMRVEIHNGSGPSGSGSTAKWSAENAAVVYGIASVSDITVSGATQTTLRLTLKQQARDQFLSLGVNDLVEIVSGEDEIRGNPGVLGTVHERISETVYDVLLNVGEVVPAAYVDPSPPASLYDSTLTDFKVRRWDGLITDLTVASDLGDTGVSVTFPTVGRSHTGDYWVFAGRTANVASASESIEKLTNEAPRGVQRHYARLALIQWNGSTPTLVDCRPKFPPLTNMVELHYVSGDGQEIHPGHTNPLKPLIVRVSNGGIPLPNVEVNFAPATANSGSVTPTLPAPATLPMRTDADGLASVDWTVNPTTYRQQVIASLVANPNLKVIFNANLSLAHEVKYSPADPDCYDPHVDNVKDALDELCARSQMLELHYVSGDGQEARPGQTIEPLIVRVSSSGTPRANVQVDFAVDLGSGTLAPASPVLTDAHGLATVNWTLDTTTYRQRVIASLVANPDLQVAFNANLSVAPEVGYAPRNPACYNPPVDTVQEALDQLCAQGGPEDPGIHILKVVWAMDDSLADNNSRVTLTRLMRGLVLTADQGIEPDSISRATCYMMLEIPMQAPDPDAWLIPLVIRADEQANGDIIQWMPHPLPASIRSALANLNGQDRETGLLARFTLKGNFIRDESSELYLDGEDYGVPDGAAPFNLLPLDGGSFLSGDKQRGGDFYMWFWVMPDEIIDQPVRVGFMVDRGEISIPVFDRVAGFISLYGSILDSGINRPELDLSVLPPGYQPRQMTYNLSSVRQMWSTLSPAGNVLSHGTVLVFAPASLQPFTEQLCSMWDSIAPELAYQPVAVPDREFLATVADRMKVEMEAGNGFSLVVVCDETTARSLAAQKPEEFDFTQFKPV